MARRFPHAFVKGVDVAPIPQDVATMPPNLEFVSRNILPRQAAVRFLNGCYHSGDRRRQLRSESFCQPVRLRPHASRPRRVAGSWQDDT